jgi:hypothetical protein
MTFSRSLLLTAATACGIALFAASPASARTICRADGICFNTSGEPIAPWAQPAYRGYSYEGRGAYEGDRYWWHRHHHRHWHDPDED